VRRRPENAGSRATLQRAAALQLVSSLPLRALQRSVQERLEIDQGSDFASTADSSGAVAQVVWFVCFFAKRCVHGRRKDFCMEGTRGFFQYFSRAAKVVKFVFSYSKLRKWPVFLKFSKSMGRLVTPALLPTPMCAGFRGIRVCFIDGWH